tara:strand:- start:3087 stop:3944 length:858 start_codon:yes stop_codon:yes gene_type:complete
LEFKLVLTAKYPYTLGETLYSGQAFRWAPILNGEVHEGILDGVRVRLTQKEDGIHCSLGSGELFDEGFIKTYLRIEDDLTQIYSQLSSDTYFTQAKDKYEGLHILRQDPWECLITFICSANNNIPRIKSLVKGISESSGERIKDQFGHFYSFPGPVSISELGELGLREIGLGFRAKYVAKVADIVVRNEIDLKSFRGLEYEEALIELLKFPGVGDKIANCVLLFSMDKLQAFPVDVWIRRVLRENYLNDIDEAIPDTKLRDWAQDYFGEFAGYANQYLFHKRRLT